MRKRNLFTLEIGLNEIEISYKDLGLFPSKFPIARLPAEKEIINISTTVFEKFGSSAIVGQTNSNSGIKHTIMVGTENDSKLLLSNTTEVSNIIGRLDANTGSYFSSPTIFDSDSLIFFENWATPRVWTMGGDLSTARTYIAGCGTKYAGLSFAGTTGTNSAVTEEYNGTSWSGGGALATARQAPGGCGTQLAGLCFGGYTSTNVGNTEEYNGTAWSGGGSLNTARHWLPGCGIQDAALTAGGRIGTGQVYTEEYNGSAWTTANNLNAAREGAALAGTQSSAVLFCGTGLISSEEYNGTSWSAGGNLNTYRNGVGGAGTSTSSISMGGGSEITEEYDGTLWIISNNLNTIRQSLAACGTQGSCISFGGYGEAYSYSAITEEYLQLDISTISLSGKLKLSITVV